MRSSQGKIHNAREGKTKFVVSAAFLLAQSCATISSVGNRGVQTTPNAVEGISSYPQEGPMRSFPPAVAKVHRGQASWYGARFDGKKTASGEIFDKSELTAAHRTFPLGSKVRVTNLDNGKSVVVEINDRGPFAEGRVIDLSQAAAQSLDIIESGKARVKVELLAETTNSEEAEQSKKK